MKNYFLKLIILSLGLLLVSCNSNKKQEDVLANPEDTYNEGVRLLNQNNLSDAAAKFETLEREHPASDLAGSAQVKRAYAYYLDGKFIDAILTIEDYTKQYPADPSTPYMYYLKGLCYFDQIVDVGRDQELSYKTIEAFEEVINRFPNSQYAKDARLKIDYAFNSLAGKEMDIGRFYLKRNNLISALGRFKTVVDKYQTSIFIPEALFRLAEIYYAFGDTSQAQVYAAVLGNNYPDSEWYIKAYALIKEHKSDDELPWYKKITKIW